MKKALILILGFLVLVGLIVWRAGMVRTVNTSGKLQVTASFYPMYYFASQIGGNKADVYNVTPASAEPHDYEPTTQDLVRVEKGSLLILNGGKLEPWGNKVKDQLKGSNVTIVTAGEGLTNKTLEEGGKTITDPHVWLDPILAKEQVAKITEGFVKAGLASCQKKDIVTSHAAFGYLAARYGLNQVAISGVSPDAEPSAQQLADLANFVKKNNIHIIFFESLVSPKLSQTLAHETGATTMVLDPIEGITDDDLRAGHTYQTVMQQNLTNLQIALQCNK